MGALQLAQAATLLARPARVVRLVCGPDDSPPIWITRLLGARVLAQAAAELARPSRSLLRLGAAVDATHAASMFAAAAVLPAYRRPALASAAAATAAAVAGAAVARGLGMTR